MTRGILLAFLAVANLAAAADPAWPPTPEAQARIDTLRRTLGDPGVTPSRRQAAREELVRLLMHPSAGPLPTPARPARAAIAPPPPVAPPAAAAVPAAPGVTRVDPPPPVPRPVPDPKGGVVQPAGKNVVDPRTGSLLLDVGNGYLDPATGRFIPKP
jgi:hypothetical protein